MNDYPRLLAELFVYVVVPTGIFVVMVAGLVWMIYSVLEYFWKDAWG